ncbi:type IV pilus modification protein PilV [Pseudomonas sp. BLCC-B13]|uniref:type IV pilus modification protein PilV n=1 Tax=Pseudomonas sp. BLCC-B13 TaxID=3025314 RepID=UPI00234F9217|nr:type IV pilus modification protein PilV [Pseudomonas sp. BLCC-B13]MDC7823681.1 type IV pilus modification protein PilV [Pseudomonas sp. BLCC-B13]
MRLRHPLRCGGFTLIEVMVALVILAVGLLGMASLMTRSQQSNESAYSRSQAALMAYDIIERMRTNLVNQIDATGNEDETRRYKEMFITQGASNYSSYNISSLPSCSTPTGPAPTGGASRVTYDLASWCGGLRASLPGIDSTNTSIRVTAPNTEGAVTVAVSIAWTVVTGESESLVVETVL